MAVPCRDERRGIVAEVTLPLEPSRPRRRINIVRGSTINAWEMQGFAPLIADFDIQAVGARASHTLLGEPQLPTVWLDEARTRVERLPLSQIRWRARNRMNDAGRQHELKGLERALAGSHLVHTVDFHYAFSEQSAAFAERNDVPLAVTRWENVPFMYWRYGSEAVRTRYARVARAAACVLATTRGAADALRAEGTAVKRVEVVYPGVDLERFHPGTADAQLLKAMNVDPGLRRILFIGRLCWEKGALDLLMAMRFVRERHPHAVLLVVGDGPDAPLLLDAATRLGLRDAVRFLSNAPYARIPDLYRCADVFALPSQPTAGWEEQYGMVLVEAMASGTPIVTTRCGAIPEVVADAALLVWPHAAAELAESIVRLLDDDGLRAALGERGRRRAETRFDARDFACQVGQIYTSLL